MPEQRYVTPCPKMGTKGVMTLEQAFKISQAHLKRSAKVREYEHIRKQGWWER